MGYNTTVVVLNDALGFIEDDPEFGKNLARAIMQVQRGEPVDVAARSGRGVHCNAATVIESHHADHHVTVVVGGNYGRVVPTVQAARRQSKSTQSNSGTGGASAQEQLE